MLRTLGGVAYILLLIQLNVFIATDWMHGEKDPFGPYPRIPDRDLLKREIEFAEECKKLFKAPKTILH